MLSNDEKHEAYVQLKTRLKKALSSGFWLEACMIEYAIMEDRTTSILLHSGISSNGSKKKLSNKLNSIVYQIEKQHPIISKKVSLDTIFAIKEWKEQRNEAVHRACIIRYDEDKLHSLADSG